MRIANNMMVYNFLSSMGKSQNRMNDLQAQLSDGKAVHKPSDDPVKAFRGLRFNVNVTMNEQYTQNAKDATEWMNQSDTALQDLSSIMISAKELVIRAVGPNPDIAFNTAGQQLDGLINHAITIGNTQNGESYIFAGQNDKVSGGPLTRTLIGGTEYVVYKGDNNKISMPIQPGTPDPTRDSINVTGEEVFGPATMVGGQATLDILSNLLRIKEELQKTPPNTTFLSTTAISQIDSAHNRVLTAETQIGSRMANYEMAQNMLQQDNFTITENMAANDDIDVPKAMMDFKNNENIYRMALSVGARIIPPSLVDFLK